MKTIQVMAAAVLLAPFVFAADAVAVEAGEHHPKVAVQQATIRLTEFRYEPQTTVLKVDMPAVLTLLNEGTVMHEFESDALRALSVNVEIAGVITEAEGVNELEIPPGAKVVLRFTPVKAGRYGIACHAAEPQDHAKAGMIGALIVE